MFFISLEFLFFFAITFLMYYILPNKLRRPLLLLMNIIFAFINGGLGTVVFLGFSIISTYWAAIHIERLHKKTVFIWVIVINVGILAVMKYLDFFSVTGNIIASLFHMTVRVPYISVFTSVGVSFYTLQLLGYLIDVYWEVIPAERDFVAYAVYGSYFPQLLSGPISRWNELGYGLKQITADGSTVKRTGINLEQLTGGLQRILWGVFKKVVISERLAIIVNEVYGNYMSYSGFAIVLATIGFAFQLYTDFSGYTDIALGASQMLGIYLPENFKAPFLAKNISEYWQRWHITMGAWLKNYIFFPILRSRLIGRIRDWAKKHLGKKAGKKIPTFITLIIFWFTVGLWHGGAWKFIIGSGLLHGMYIIGGELLEPVLNKLVKLFHLNMDTFSYRLFLRARTFSLVCVGFVFFNAESTIAALKILKRVLMITDYRYNEISVLLSLMDWKSMMILFVAMFILVVYDIMREYYMKKDKKGGAVAEWLGGQNFVFRMFCYWLLVVMIVMSLNLDMSEYIYMQF